MPPIRLFVSSLVLALALSVVAAPYASGQDETVAPVPPPPAPAEASGSMAPTVEASAPSEAAANAIDDAMPIEQLRVMIRPMTEPELAAFARAWMGQVEQVSKQIARQNLARLRGVAASPAPSSPTLTALRDQRQRLAERADIILDAWEAKGGDVKADRTYLVVVSGIELDIVDAGLLWETLQGWLFSQEGGIRWGVRLVQFFVVLLLTLAIAWALGKAVKRVVQRQANLSALLKDFIVKATVRTVQFIGLLVALTFLNINVGPLLVMIGALGFVVAFALQGSLSNFASGILMLVYRPFDVGDAIDVAGVSGVVNSLTLFTTKLTSFDNKQIIMPNNSVWGGVITNITGNPTRRVDLTFGISYSDDIGKAIDILKQCVAEQEGVLEEPAVNIQVMSLGESSVDLICRPWTKTADYWTVYWSLTRRVKERFDAEGITIPFPQQDVHMHQAATNG